MFVPGGRRCTRKLVFRRSPCLSSDSVADFLSDMETQGFEVLDSGRENWGIPQVRHPTRKEKACSSCGTSMCRDTCRRAAFSRRSWSREQPVCKSCTFQQQVAAKARALVAKEQAKLRLEAEFAPPPPAPAGWLARSSVLLSTPVPPAAPPAAPRIGMTAAEMVACDAAGWAAVSSRSVASTSVSPPSVVPPQPRQRNPQRRR